MHGNPAFRGGFSGNATCGGDSSKKCGGRGSCSGNKRDGARCWGRVCPILKFIVCLNPTMSKMHKVLVLWVWIVLLALLIGLPIRYSAYGPEMISSSPGDMRHIQNRFNSFMCTGLEITNKESETVDVYTTPDAPSIDKNETLEQTVQTASTIYDRRFEYWGTC
ncbi:unnamed protein product [Owenia fusiformis]|uniref:Uncharacterized protein n=1 Tax=Owenia fusiformis TaxID=6347 RepID=A0A8S4PFM2_OWEFU|nr:unnamed protein product [Owenia fusiformis]